MTHRIYLAGKVGHTDWRHSICHLRDDFGLEGGTPFEVDGVDGFPLVPINGFEAVSTGPVPICCDHGCFHGENNHGLGLIYADGHDPEFGPYCVGAFADRRTVRRWCEEAIRRSDAVFAWIEDKTCFGTLVEIGMAKALGVPVYLAVPSAFANGYLVAQESQRSDIDDLWFAVETADFVCFHKDTAKAAFDLFFQKFQHPDLRTMPYQDYLQTDHWKMLRSKAREAAGERCQLCNAANRLHVHHRTYERRGSELLSDLIVLCEDCHAKFHNKLPKVRV